MHTDNEQQLPLMFHQPDQKVSYEFLPSSYFHLKVEKYGTSD